MGLTLETLTLKALQDAVAGQAAAIRIITKLQPVGGQGDKIFPPTYAGGQYAQERRRLNDEVVSAVLLDSVQSQANRMEQALKRARERGDLKFPLIVSDFTPRFPDIGRITALDAPHRVADAIFRDSLLKGTPFRDSDLGKRFVAARTTNATPLLELCPTALVFGVWDSTGLGPSAGLGAKFQRALVSEIVGIEAEEGVRTASRIDPLPISAQVEVYEAKSGGWTTEPAQARKEKDNPVPYRSAEAGKGGKPSSINLGNVTPDIARDRRTRKPLPGGITVRYALQTTVLSLAALRRLTFPLPDGKRSDDADTAARTVLAALALAAIVLQRVDGYDLRSRCQLTPTESSRFELVPNDGGDPVSASLGVEESKEVFAEAAKGVRASGLPWADGDIVLDPSEKLLGLITKSREVGFPAETEESAVSEAE
jgi:CRISPR-associated protein Csb1